MPSSHGHEAVEGGRGLEEITELPGLDRSGRERHSDRQGKALLEESR
jgi:hypothetical protein